MRRVGRGTNAYFRERNRERKHERWKSDIEEEHTYGDKILKRER